MDEHAKKLDLNEIITCQKQPVETRSYLQEEDTYYDVMQGNTLQSIARRFGLAIEKLYQLNLDTKGRETNIQVGEQILIETSNSEGD